MLKHSVILAGSSMVAQMAVAALYVIVARLAGPEQLGRTVATIAASAFIAGLIDFGSSNLWIRQLSQGVINQKILFTKITSKLTIAFFVCTSLSMTAFFIMPGSSYWAVGPLAFTTAFYQSFLVPLKAISAARKLAYITIQDRIGASVFFGLAVIGGLESSSALIGALCLGALSAGMTAYILTPNRVRAFSLRESLAWPWRGCLSYGLGGITLSAQALDASILLSVAGPAATGVYGAVNRWTQPLGVFASAFSTAGLPIVSRTKSVRKAYPTLKYSWWLIGVAAALCVAVAIFSPAIVALLLGDQYTDSALVLTILSLGTIPSLINQPLYVFLQSMNAQRPVAWATALAVTFQLSSCALLSVQFGALGAAISLAVSQLLLLASFLGILIRRERAASELSSTEQLVDSSI